MEIVSVRFIDGRLYSFITDCTDTDTCPGCGAGYKVGMSKCEYCKRPVSHEAPEHKHPPHPEHKQGAHA